MRTRTIRWIALGSMAVLGGCRGAGGTPGEKPPPTTARPAPTQSPVDSPPSVKCSSGVFIRTMGPATKMNGSTCPPSRGWSVSTFSALHRGKPLPRAVPERCVYFQGAQPPRTYEMLRREKLSEPPEACRDGNCTCDGIVTPQATFHDGVGAPLYESEKTNLGHHLGLGASSKIKVRVAVVDTRDEKPSNADDDHGAHVRRIIENVACPDSKSCDVTTVSLRGSPTQIALAGAIEEAVDDWITSGAEKRLVINVSLGWVRPDATRDAPVLEMLKSAACEGALIVAAAGNVTSASDSGYVYPAAWRSESVPSVDDCADYLFSKGLPDSASHGQPLVTAVGGVDATDKPLGISRKSAQPPLVALAMGITYPGVGNEGAYPWFMNGTSAASALVAAAAARVWLTDADMKPVKVVERLESKGISGTGTPHRLSVCKALGLTTGCNPPAFGAGKLPVLPKPPPSVPVINPPPIPQVPPNPAPDDEVTPQPGSPGCDACIVYIGNASLYVNLDSTWAPVFLPTTLYFTASFTGGRTFSTTRTVSWPSLATFTTPLGAQWPGPTGFIEATVSFSNVGSAVTNPEQILYSNP